MKNKTKKIFNLIYGRTLMVIILLVIQVAILVGGFIWLSDDLAYIYSVFNFITTVLVIYILNKKGNPTFKLAWMIPILVFPVFGALFYLFVKFQFESRLINYKLLRIIDETQEYLSQEDTIIKDLEKEDMQVANLAKYMKNTGGYPIYRNTDIKYFPSGEAKFEEMKIQLEQAKHFIFMEYFIVEEGYMWNSILEILERKVKEGIEVRKFVAFHENIELIKKIRNEVEVLGNLAVSSSFNDNIEITHIDAQKGIILERIAKKMGLKNNEVMVLGDSFNDYSMFEVFEESVAMKNAIIEIREIAKYITESNDNLGVAKAIMNVVNNTMDNMLK